MPSRSFFKAYLVGGCVRDTLRGDKPEDYDIVTSARPEDVRGIFVETVPVGERFGVVLVIENGVSYEVASFRRDEGYQDGRRPMKISYASAQEDVKRRDFTVNGLLLDPETMESKIVPHLFFAGEILDVDGDCGGYNLQWAWSSGFLAGKSAAENV